MTTATKPGSNGRLNNRNGHVPASREVGGRQPLDAVSTAAEPNSATGDKPATDGRTTKGTFAPGNTFARGNPNARKMAALRAALLECATAERMKALGEKLYEMAMAGDLAAAKLLLAYAIGKAPEAVDADRLDLDEWAIIAAAPTRAQFLRAALDGLNPHVAAGIIGKAQGSEQSGTGFVSAFDKLRDEQAAGDGPLLRQFRAEREARIGK
jgi:hypothetical protein